MAKQTWIVDINGRKGLVDDLDRWTPLGWTETSAPAGDEHVWLQHEEHGGKQLFAAAAAAAWSALGWWPSGPPEPVDLTKDPVFVDQPDQPEQLPEATPPAPRLAAETPKTRETQEK